MFVRVESVLFVGILLGTCLSATTGLSLLLTPDHLHSAPGRPVTFTCRADHAVSACEFLVRFKDVDLGVVNPAQTRSGSWELTSPDDQRAKGRAVIPAREASPVGVATASGPQDVGGEEAIDPRSRPATGRSGTQGTSETRTTAALDDAREGETMFAISPVSAKGRTSSGVNVNSKVNVEASPSRGWSQSATESTTRTPPGFYDRPAWITTRPSMTERQLDTQGDEPYSRPRVGLVGNHSLVVLGAKDAVRGGTPPLKRHSSPYPPSDAQFCRRRHGWQYVYRAPTRAPPSSPSLRPRLNIDGYQWQGRAADDRCTLTLPAVIEGRHLVGCRARQEKGGWEYATASMDVNSFQPMGVTVQTPPIAAPGSHVSVTFKSATRMTSCYVNGTRGVMSASRRECRATLRAVPGLVWGAVALNGTRREARATFVRVRTVQTRVELALPKTRFMEGEFFTATCAVGALQQPAPNISWYLGDELLRADADDDIAYPKWLWPWEGRELRQSLYMTLTSDDDGLPLTCQVDHPALAAPLTKSVTMRVTQDIDDGTKGCGRLPAPEVTERLMGGSKAANVPWIASIYRRRRTSEFEHVCGGTLVSRRLVVSSAQCFWDVTFTRVSDPSLFRVAVGRSGREWMPSDQRAQMPGIVRLAVPKHFIGRSAHFAYDIAVLVLDSPVTLSDNVVPACVDLTGLLPELQPGDLGTVAGWGVTETGSPSSGLRSLELPYVDTEQCYRAVDEDLHRFLSYDKFCAGFRDQAKSVCPGDSGGGLVFEDPNSGRHYLRGVASVAFAPIGNDDNCFADLYTGFTLVSEYASWIFKQAPAAPVAA